MKQNKPNTIEEAQEGDILITPNNKIDSNEIQIGAILLSSTNTDIKELAGLVVSLLQTDCVKEYLDLIKKQSEQKRVGYAG